VAKNRLEEVLMVNHPVLQAINLLWHRLYSNMIIVDAEKFYAVDVPFDAETVSKIIRNCCKVARDVKF
jgi:dynein heavy chain, axonemal